MSSIAVLLGSSLVEGEGVGEGALVPCLLGVGALGVEVPRGYLRFGSSSLKLGRGEEAGLFR